MERRDRWLQLIAIFKFVKVAVLIAVGLGALHLLDPGFVAHIERLLTRAFSPLGRERVQRFIEHLNRMHGTKVTLFAIGAFLYAALFAVEGTGLWLQKHWAEYLTIVSTALLIPPEVYELVHRLTLPRISTLVVNLAVLAYLIVRHHRRQRQRKERAATPTPL